MMMRTEMVLETSISYIHLMLVMARENYIEKFLFFLLRRCSPYRALPSSIRRSDYIAPNDRAIAELEWLWK
jgi:hypothetical protein